MGVCNVVGLLAGNFLTPFPWERDAPLIQLTNNIYTVYIYIYMYIYIYVKLILAEVLLQLATQTSRRLTRWLDKKCNELHTAVWLAVGTASSRPLLSHLA